MVVYNSVECYHSHVFMMWTIPTVVLLGKHTF